MQFKFLKTAFTGLVLCICGVANAGLITWDLTDPDTSLSATFVFDDDTIDGLSDSTDLVSIKGDFGDGLFTYFFGETVASNGVIYEVTDTRLTRWKSGGSITSYNDSTSGALTYANIWHDASRFTLGGVSSEADWNGGSIENSSATQLNIVSSIVPEPSTIAIFALGMIGLASRRFKKQS